MLDRYIFHSTYRQKIYLFILNLKNLQQKSSSFTQDVKMGHKIFCFLMVKMGSNIAHPHLKVTHSLNSHFLGEQHLVALSTLKTKSETEKPC